MDKIQKFLLKLDKKQRQLFSNIFADIMILEFKKYDIKALKGLKELFRLRKGNIRIVFAKQNNRGIVLDIAYRKDIYEQ